MSEITKRYSKRAEQLARIGNFYDAKLLMDAAGAIDRLLRSQKALQEAIALLQQPNQSQFFYMLEATEATEATEEV